MTSDHDNSELLLTAFRYVAGELSAEDAATFETLLSGDQPARDALADAVVLSEAVAVEEFDRIHPLVTVPARRTMPKWGAVAAVCLLAVVSFFLFNQPDAEQAGVVVRTADPLPTPEMGDAHSVLSLWSQLGDDSELYGSDPYLAEESEALPPAASEVPDWMLSAVAGDEPASDMPDELRELMDDPDRENL